MQYRTHFMMWFSTLFSVVVGMSIVLMYMIWLPSWYSSAYNNGYRQTYTTISPWHAMTNPSHLACESDDYQACRYCNFTINAYYILHNESYIFTYFPCLGCNTVKPLACPVTYFEAIQFINQTLIQNNSTGRHHYLDPNRNVNGSYIIYDINRPKYYDIYPIYAGLIMCSRDIQGLSAGHNATISWIVSFVFILFGEIVIYIFILVFAWCRLRYREQKVPLLGTREN